MSALRMVVAGVGLGQGVDKVLAMSIDGSNHVVIAGRVVAALLSGAKSNGSNELIR